MQKWQANLTLSVQTPTWLPYVSILIHSFKFKELSGPVWQPGSIPWIDYMLLKIACYVGMKFYNKIELNSSLSKKFYN